jgi:4-amino-4-deoxy-L-arabinose transferase-like glycosyltransferase
MKLGLLKKHLSDFLSVGFLLILLPFFFYNLGHTSLVSWDEAWYAEIARNILKSGDLFNLRWNEMAYYDHPPVGFWLIAIGETLFGYGEFGVRSASAVFGFLSLVVIYFLGKELFNRVVGFCSAIGLASSFWFLFRSRSGNLDIFLTFFFILTFYTAIKAVKNRKWLVPFALSFVALILTKTGIPFTILPSLIIVFWKNKFQKKDYFLVFGIMGILGGIWAVSQFLTNSSFLDRYLQIGLPGVKAETSYQANFSLAKIYLHDGIGRWFWPGVAGIISSIFLGIILRQKKWLILPVFFISFFTPFVFSPKGHIWHLIPLHPFMIIAFFATAFWFGNTLRQLKWINSIVIFKKSSQFLLASFLVVFALYLASGQLKSAWVQFIDQPRYISDEQILSEAAGKAEGKFFIDDDFGPTAVWYSEKQVSQIRDDDVKRLFMAEGVFTNAGKFVLITKQYRLDQQGIAKERYKILKSDRDKILVISDK